MTPLLLTLTKNGIKDDVQLKTSVAADEHKMNLTIRYNPSQRKV